MRWPIVLVAACGSSPAAPDAARDSAPPVDAAADAATYPPVTISGTAGRDEDPTLLRTAAGRIYLAWFSERDGDGGNLYLRRSADGLAWDPPIQMTSGADSDFYPNLAEASGTLHAVWMRNDAGIGLRHIMHATSADGATWSTPAPITTVNATDDWTPTVAVAPSGTLVVAFARNTCAQACYAIVVSTSADGTSWSTPVPFGLAATGLTDHLPILARTGDHLTMTWNRYTSTPGHDLPYTTPTSEVMVATSVDGLAWTPAVQLTSNATPDVFPWLYADETGRWYATWLATDHTVEQPLDATAPTGTVPTNGYSPRVLWTGVPHRYVATWVEGADPQQEIVSRAYSR